MSANVNGQPAGGREVIIVGAGEDIDSVAAMAAGVGAHAHADAGTRYMPIDAVTADTFTEFSAQAAQEAGAESWTIAQRADEDAAPADVGASAPPAGVEEHDTDAGAAALRAARIRAARQRRAQVVDALVVRDDDGAPTRTEDADNVSARIRNVTTPGGRPNRRMLYVLIVVGALGLLVVLKGASSKVKENGAPNKSPGQTAAGAPAGDDAAARRDGTAMRVGTPGDGTLHSPEGVMANRSAEGRTGNELPGAALGMGNSVEPAPRNILGGQVVGSQPAPPGGQAPLLAGRSNVQASAGTGQEEGGGLSASVPYGNNAGGASAGFSFKMRNADAGGRERVSGESGPAGELAAERAPTARPTERPEGRQRKTEPASGARLPAGTRIPMTLLEPLQSGIETTANARVDAEVRDAKGAVLLKAGTIITIPFLAAHANGRMMNAADEAIEVPSAAGAPLVLTGAVKGTDGLVGLPGRVTKSGQGNTIGRFVRGAARIGVRQVGSVMPSGGVADDIEREAGGVTDINSAVADRYGVRGGQREVVNVPASVRFTFVVGK